MVEARYEIYLMDEAPGLGSGKRVVVAQVGRVWVRARNEIGEHHYTRIKLSVWETFNPRLIG